MLEISDPLGDELYFERVDLADPFGFVRVVMQSVLVVMMHAI